MKRAIVWCFAVGVGLTCLSSCIGVGGSTNTPTKGQELVDLKVALDHGAINQAEYDMTKARIMSR